MTNLRPHASSKDMADNSLDGFERQGRIIASLFPDVPRFTVCIAVAFPHTEEDAEGEMNGEEGLAPILDCTTLHVRAVNVHTAIDMAMTEMGQSLREALGDDAVFTLICVSAFTGHAIDLAEDYDYEKSAFFSAENAMDDYEGVAA